MALWKALAADMKSGKGWWEHDFGPWIKNEWYEVEGPVVGTGKDGRCVDVNGILAAPPNGFLCSDDIVHCQYPVLTEYLAQVEVDGDSIIYEKDQVWQKMRVVSVKAWPSSKSILKLDWAEGQCHERWAAIFPGEAAVYDMKHYQGQFADMLEIIEPLWKSMYTHGDEIYGLRRIWGRNLLKSTYSVPLERAVALAHFLAMCLVGYASPRGIAPWVRIAAHNRPDIWETVKGNVEDHWATLPEVE